MAAGLRLSGLNWDGGIGAHPDERYVVGLAEALHWSGHIDPLALEPGFAYGHLPVYLLALLGRLSRSGDFLLLGRVLTALLDVGTVAWTLALARRLYGRRAGLLAAALLAVTVLHVQQAHFYTTDVPLTFFCMGALFFALRLAGRGRVRDAWLAGGWAGLALGTKWSGLSLLLPLGAACLVAPTTRSQRSILGLVTGLGAAVAFGVTNPFALARWPLFWHNVTVQAAMARGALDLPYVRQYHATWPYLYVIVQQVRWGMGWGVGLLAFGGLAYGLGRVVRRPPPPGEWVLLAWLLPGLAFYGGLGVKFPRYVLPLLPVLLLYAAALLTGLGRRRRKWLWAGMVIPFVLALFRCLALVAAYERPHPWLVAAEWLSSAAPPGATVAVEAWDHPLPVDRTDLEIVTLPVFDEDTPEKWATMEERLARVDYVVVASRRGYAALARWPERYPRTTEYYRRLFRGELGFRPVACFDRFPRLGPVALVDDPTAGLGFSLPAVCGPAAPLPIDLGRLDESFVVYDHPQVIVFVAPIPPTPLPPQGEGGLF